MLLSGICSDWALTKLGIESSVLHYKCVYQLCCFLLVDSTLANKLLINCVYNHTDLYKRSVIWLLIKCGADSSGAATANEVVPLLYKIDTQRCLQ